MQNYRNSGTAEFYDVIGVMSGTSVDGLDLAHCRFELDPKSSWNYRIMHTETVRYSQKWRDRLLNVIYSDPDEIFSLDVEFGEFIGRHVNKFIRKYKIVPRIIASHGHTVFHQPTRKITIQIGDGIAINQITGIPTINDFRKLDVILGGQGAPLVPVGDALLFPQFRFCLNLGGFSNVSFHRNRNRIAFDICPVNIILNRLARKAGKPFDKNGSMGRRGKLIPKMLERLNNLDYYSKPFPKSLGLEWVDKNIMPILEKYSGVQDAITTYTHHVASQINQSLISFASGGRGISRVLVSGGGAFNSYLIELLGKAGKGKLAYEIPEPDLVNFKEAMIFGFLGVLRLRGEINTLRSVTGASRDSCGGTLHDNSGILQKPGKTAE
ncbi:MAG TPA: anhydro-N-acetylmuramic acid kinase [Cyclobacteriaceae bacterium]|nr:anhydro-N-acetylmuramic acid kinase [Cyclobacteriaceae bacterium]